MDSESKAHPLLGLHHVTAISGNPADTVHFYGSVLGLRLVKRTVNFDDPGTYHLYFGDGLGSPGTVITFFPWPRALPGQPGFGQATRTQFSVPKDSLGLWSERLESAGVAFEAPADRLSERALAFDDPDGLGLELVESGSDDRPGWDGSDVPAGARIRGFHASTLTVRDPEPTGAMLELLGLERTAQSENRIRFGSSETGPGRLLDLVIDENAPPGRVSRGSVHHIAWRVADDDAQRHWIDRLRAAGVSVTPVQDRQYFRSIYFREPGGVLFEIATDPPGFTRDESVETLGTELKLPPWLEPRRAEIESVLPALKRTAAGHDV